MNRAATTQPIYESHVASLSAAFSAIQPVAEFGMREVTSDASIVCIQLGFSFTGGAMVSVVAKEREPTESKNMIRAFATFVMRESKCTKAANGFQAVTDRNFSNTDPTLRQRGVRSASGQRNEWEKFVPEKGTGRTGITEGSNPQWFRADG